MRRQRNAKICWGVHVGMYCRRSKIFWKTKIARWGSSKGHRWISSSCCSSQQQMWESERRAEKHLLSLPQVEPLKVGVPHETASVHISLTKTATSVSFFWCHLPLAFPPHLLTGSTKRRRCDWPLSAFSGTLEFTYGKLCSCVAPAHTPLGSWQEMET